MQKIKVLSLFDGISCARVALERLHVPVEYYASEVDRFAISISRKNWHDVVHVGDVRKIDGKKYRGLHLLIGGSPCQDLSIANNKRAGLAGKRSGLFWEYVRILKEAKPRYFVLENVASMPIEVRETISKELGVQPIMIDAALVSAQTRKRLFWTNIPNVQQPKDRGIMLKDILVDERLWDPTVIYQYRRYYLRRTAGGKVPTLTANMGTGGHNVPFVRIREATKKGYTDVMLGEVADLVHPNSKSRRGRRMSMKCHCLTTGDMQFYRLTEHGLRKLLPVECERLQSLPDGYTGGGIGHAEISHDRQRLQCRSGSPYS